MRNLTSGAYLFYCGQHQDRVNSGTSAQWGKFGGHIDIVILSNLLSKVQKMLVLFTRNPSIPSDKQIVDY